MDFFSTVINHMFSGRLFEWLKHITQMRHMGVFSLIASSLLYDQDILQFQHFLTCTLMSISFIFLMMLLCHLTPFKRLQEDATRQQKKNYIDRCFFQHQLKQLVLCLSRGHSHITQLETNYSIMMKSFTELHNKLNHLETIVTYMAAKMTGIPFTASMQEQQRVLTNTISTIKHDYILTGLDSTVTLNDLQTGTPASIETLYQQDLHPNKILDETTPFIEAYKHCHQSGFFNDKTCLNSKNLLFETVESCTVQSMNCFINKMRNKSLSNMISPHMSYQEFDFIPDASFDIQTPTTNGSDGQSMQQYMWDINQTPCNDCQSIYLKECVPNNKTSHQSFQHTMCKYERTDAHSFSEIIQDIY